jgi:serine/threonine protein kinase
MALSPGTLVGSYQITAALNHPHIVTIYSTEEADGIRFLTMELVEGQPLDALIPPTGLALPRFLELALPLADAAAASPGRRPHRHESSGHRELSPLIADGPNHRSI